MTTPKEKGDAAFRLSDWKGAIDHYTIGINNDPNSTESGFLYSNRAAAYIQISQFDRALLDAASCCRALPTSSKGQLRAAEAHRRVREYKESISCYTAAMKLAETPDIKLRYQTARNKTIAVSVELQKEKTIGDPGRTSRLEALTKSGLSKVTNQPGRFLSATENFVNARKLLNEGFEVIASSSDLSAEQIKFVLEKFSDTILIDPSAFGVPSEFEADGPSQVNNYFDQLQAAIFTGFKHYTCRQIAQMTPNEFCLEANEIRLSHFGGDWAPMRAMLDFTIRELIIQGYIYHKQESYNEACTIQRVLLQVVSSGHSLWKPRNSKTIANETCGHFFTRDSLTQSLSGQCYLIECVISHHGPNPAVDCEFSDLRAMGEAIIVQFDKNPGPTAKNQNATTSTELLLYYRPLAIAHTSLAFVAAEESLTKKVTNHKTSMVTYHPKFSRVAATHHRIASSLMPLDSIDRLVNLIEALACDTRQGGYTIDYLLDKSAEMEEVRKEVISWYGQFSAFEELELSIRTSMRMIRNWLTHQSMCCCQKSTREIDFRHTVKSWPLSGPRDFRLFEPDPKDRTRITLLNGGKCFCKSEICSDYH